MYVCMYFATSSFTYVYDHQVNKEIIYIYIYIYIYIFVWKPLRHSDKSLQVHITLPQLWCLAELIWNFKSKFCWYSWDKMIWKETLVRCSDEYYTLHHRMKNRYLAKKSMFDKYFSSFQMLIQCKKMLFC